MSTSSEADVLVRARNNIVSIVGNTNKGCDWMYKNVGTAIHTIQRDVLEDFINNLKEAELTYEET